MPLPTPLFTEWFPWTSLGDGTPPELDAKLGKVGCYILARFLDRPTPGAADPADEAVIYVGETHGDSTSLRRRLNAFADSAGLNGFQRNGHYAAWGFPDLFDGAYRLEADGDVWRCDPRNLWFAVCAWGASLPAHLRGIFPTAVEQQAIWAYTERWHTLPALNNSGRVHLPNRPPMPDIPDDDLDAALARATDPPRAESAATSIVQRLAVGMYYSARRRPTPATYEGWRGVERTLGRETLYVGWYDADLSALTLSAYRGEERLHDGGAARTRDELVAMLQAFWEAWHA